MKLAAAILAVAGFASLPSWAEEGRWEFRQGASWTYEAETVLEWSVAEKGGSPAAQRGLKQRQVETVTLRLEVTAVDAEGNASIAGTVTSVNVKSVAVGQAEWDSTKSKRTGFLGFKRYEALLDLAFTATVAPNGTVLEAKRAGTPDPAATPATEKENAEIPAQAMHVPTSPRAWLELIFRPTPPARKGTVRTVRFIAEEQLSVSFSRNDRVDGRPCARVEFETPDRDHIIDPKTVFAVEHSDPNALAWAAVRLGFKRGEAWFARPGGCLVRLEAASDATVSYDSKLMTARMTWKIGLKASQGGR